MFEQVQMMCTPTDLPTLAHDDRTPTYLPSISSFFFSSAFICFTTALWSVEPVSCVRVAGGALSFGREVSWGCSLAGRVAVVFGGEASSAHAAIGWKPRSEKAIRIGPIGFIVPTSMRGRRRAAHSTVNALMGRLCLEQAKPRTLAAEVPKTLSADAARPHLSRWSTGYLQVDGAAWGRPAFAPSGLGALKMERRAGVLETGRWAEFLASQGLDREVHRDN